MLNYLVTVLLLNSVVVAFFFAFKINRIEQVFSSLSATYIAHSVKLNELTLKYYFDKDSLVENTKQYFTLNLKDIDHSLKFAFREDDLNTEISDCPNIVQINISASILFKDTYMNNVRFYLDGRKVSKDWFSSL